MKYFTLAFDLQDITLFWDQTLPKFGKANNIDVINNFVKRFSIKIHTRNRLFWPYNDHNTFYKDNCFNYVF